ncbi:hypothetical protein [Helicovermis profundi]|uniref:Uncharacterized protein n=1 Tax=Helicovermis profundi TaxID=3065157 RepID=A0AAU9E153_9FIRM|nr:hypothetical protein HLPR_04950 [Clostridia bacterium S502]
MTACKNINNESINEVLHRKFQKEYREVRGSKLIVKAKKLDEK